MSAPAELVAVAQAWLDAFNAHDVDALVALYDEACTHTSPKIRALHPETGGKLVGDIKAARFTIADGASFKGNVDMEI